MVTHPPRKTRFRLLVRLYRTGLVTRRVPSERFQASAILLSRASWRDVEDLDWLLADGPRRVPENERRLAINTALQLSREAGSSAALLTQIEEVAQADAVMTEAYETWMRPRTQSTQEIEQEREIEEIQNRMVVEQAVRDQSSIDFVAGPSWQA